MEINRLQKALVIMNKGGKGGAVFAEHDILYLWPVPDYFTADEVSQLSDLGFLMNDEGGFECFT